MIYNFKEYNPIFDTPIKRQQELAISRKIMDLLNKNKFDSLEEFITKNSNYQDFLKSNSMQTVIKHFGNTLIEGDYAKIIENLRILSKTKQEFEKNNIKTTNIDNKEFNTFKGENRSYYIDNSNSDKSIEQQMKDLQSTQEDFQTSDINKNTENLFSELEQKKETLNPIPLSSVNYNELTDKEKEIFQVAYDYQQSNNSNIRIDINKEIIVDEEDNIMKISKENGEIKIVKDENGLEKDETHKKGYQKQLTPNKDTIYSV